MNYEPVVKPAAEQMRVTPNLIDYHSARDAFSWDRVCGQIDGLPEGGTSTLEED